MRKYWLVIVISIIGTACKHHAADTGGKEVSWKIMQSKKLGTPAQNISITNVPVEKFNYSFNGNWFCVDSNIVLFDNLFRMVSVLSAKGKLLKQYGGMDTAKNNNTWSLPYTISKNDSGYVSVFERSIAYTDPVFNVKKTRRIRFRTKKEKLTSILGIPDPDNMTVYELNDRNKNYWQVSQDEMIVSLESEAPSFNPYNSPEYFKTARCFGLINFKKGTLKGIPVTKSKVYKDTCCLSVQDAAYIIRKDKEYHVQFAADTLIYVYDESFRPQYAYGLKGAFIPNFIHNNGLDIAFDDDKYKQLESGANTIDALFVLEDKTVGRIINNRTTGKKFFQKFVGVDLLSETEIPADFTYTGTLRNMVVGLLKQDESKKKIELCFVK